MSETRTGLRAPCVLATDVRLGRRDGHVWAAHPAASYATWKPFVEAFGDVAVIGREDTTQIESTLRVDGPGVIVVDVPTYKRLTGLLRTAPKVWRAMQTVGKADSVFVGRLPEPLSLLMFLRSRRIGARYVSMVVSDPGQLFAAHFGGRRGRVIGAAATLLTRAIVRRSAGVIYVSDWWLQNSYPAIEGIPTLARSNVQLPEDAFVENLPEKAHSSDAELKLVSVGSLTGLVKGPDLLIEAVARLRDHGHSVSLTFVGGGQDLGSVRDLARHRGVEAFASFVGHISDVAELRATFDAADVYVSASRAEGLPRATVEAMARGLAVVSSRAGAAVELVDEQWLVDIDSVDQIVEKILELRDPQLRSRVAERNEMTARRLQQTSASEHLTTFLRSHFVSA